MNEFLIADQSRANHTSTCDARIGVKNGSNNVNVLPNDEANCSLHSNSVHNCIHSPTSTTSSHSPAHCWSTSDHCNANVVDIRSAVNVNNDCSSTSLHNSVNNDNTSVKQLTEWCHKPNTNNDNNSCITPIDSPLLTVNTSAVTATPLTPNNCNSSSRSSSPSLNCLTNSSIENNAKRNHRIALDDNELMSLSVNELRHYWKQQELYVNWIETQLKQFNRDKCDLISLRESEEKLKQQQLEANRRENILVMRLTTKEQEMQDYLNQIQELKQSQVPSNGQLQCSLIDPTVNLMFEKMKKEVETSRAKVEEMQNELNAWKFTPDSNTGKRLMAKCRLLYQENEELGKMMSSGRIAKLEGELALQKNFSEEMKKSQSELDEFLLELDEDVEGMQNTIYYLQQQLKEAKEKLSKFENNCNNSDVNNENCVEMTTIENNCNERDTNEQQTYDECVNNDAKLEANCNNSDNNEQQNFECVENQWTSCKLNLSTVKTLNIT